MKIVYPNRWAQPKQAGDPNWYFPREVRKVETEVKWDSSGAIQDLFMPNLPPFLFLCLLLPPSPLLPHLPFTNRFQCRKSKKANLENLRQKHWSQTGGKCINNSPHHLTQLVNTKCRSDPLWVFFLLPESYSSQNLMETEASAIESGDEKLEEAEVEMPGTWLKILTPLLAESWEWSPSTIAPRS